MAAFLPPLPLFPKVHSSLSSPPPICAQTPPPPPPAQITPSTPSVKDLEAQSRRNTRISGPASQQFALARRHEQNGDFESALSLYTSIISTNPTFAPAYSNRANIYTVQKQYQQALSDYSLALSLAPLDRDAYIIYVNRGLVNLALEKPLLALEDLNMAAKLQPKNPIVLSNRAAVWETLQKWDNAIRDYQNALKSNDVQPFWNRYALVLFQRNRPAEALAVLKRVEGRFDAPDVHAALAVVLFDKGDLGGAEGEWSRIERPKLFTSRSFLEHERKWPPRALQVMQTFRGLTD